MKKLVIIFSLVSALSSTALAGTIGDSKTTHRVAGKVRIVDNLGHFWIYATLDSGKEMLVIHSKPTDYASVSAIAKELQNKDTHVKCMESEATKDFAAAGVENVCKFYGITFQ